MVAQNKRTEGHSNNKRVPTQKSVLFQQATTPIIFKKNRVQSFASQKKYLFGLCCLQCFYTNFGCKLGHLWSHVICFNDTFATHGKGVVKNAT